MIDLNSYNFLSMFVFFLMRLPWNFQPLIHIYFKIIVPLQNSFVRSIHSMKRTEMNRIPESKEDFEKLFFQYYSVLCRIAHGYVYSSAVVEEIVSDVFVRLWNNRSTIIITSSIKDYLFKSVQNSCIDNLRAEKKQRQQTTYIDDNEISCTTLADLGENPLDYLVSNETEQRILKAIDELPERYQQTFKLRIFDELSYEEIAAKMGVTKNTVKSNLREARLELREKLKDISFLLFLYL